MESLKLCMFLCVLLLKNKGLLVEIKDRKALLNKKIKNFLYESIYQYLGIYGFQIFINKKF